MSRGDQRFVVRYWGVRGSIPTPGPNTARYGGNTTCIEVRCDDRTLIIDTGTGARLLGNRLLADAGGDAVRVSIVYSHLHMDHIQGFPFFGPIYDPRSEIEIFSPSHGEMAPREVLGIQMAFPWFPVNMAELPSTLTFTPVTPGSSFEVNGISVRTCPLNHPGGAMAIRIDHRGHSFVQASDVEHTDDAPDAALVELARGADYLSYDSTYVEGAEYEKHKGWGHSTWQAGLAVARAADTRFIAFHHDPEHDDRFMDGVAEQLAAAQDGALVACEGMELDLLAGEVRVVPLTSTSSDATAAGS